MDKQILNFTVNEQVLVCENPIKISTNKVNYIEAHFDLGENWSGFDSVRAVWFNDFNCISTVLDSLGNCAVPFEVMKRKGNVKVNLVGSISEDDVLTDRLTSYPVVAVIVDCTAQIVGSNTQPITPSEFEQFAQRVHTDADRAETAASNAETSAQNASDSATSAHNSAESAHDDKVAIEEAIAEVIQQIEDFEQVQVVVNTLPPSSQATSDFTDGVLTLGIPQGVKGDTGNGIQSIAKTGTSGLVDTYTITFTDGQTTTFTVTNGAKGDTGNGISTIEKTSTVGLVDTYTITYTDGTTTTFTVTNGEKGDKGDTGEVSLSELEDATVVQTLSDNTPYNYRRTNNGLGAGVREYDEIVGASVGWNQLVNTTDTSVTIQSGHKYYSNINNVKTIGLSNGTAISINDGTKDNIIDLTLFNSQIADYVYSLEQSTAGSGVAWLRTHFPKLFDNGYQPFDSGSIKSVSGLTAHEMVGKNLFDKTMHINSGYRDDDGNVQASTGSSYTDAIKVFPNTAYTLSGNFATSGYASRVYYLTSDGDWISRTNSIYVSQFPYTFTTPSNCSYIQIQTATASTLDVAQFEFGSVATDFEPYESHTYPLDSSVELRGKYVLDNGQLKAVGDVWKSDGTVTRRYGVVDLGTLNSWIKSETISGHWRFRATLAGAGGNSGKQVANMICTKYSAITGNESYTGEKDGITGFSTGGYIFVCDEAYSDAVSFKSAMQGVKLVYPLATPTTESATAYDNPQWCDSHGTEEYVGSELPVGHNTDYPMTMVDCADGLGNGTYEARLTIANGVKTFTWQSV